MSERTHASELPALFALCAGALSIGSSGIFVRLSETGPTATAFWRGAFALPFLLAVGMARAAQRIRRCAPRCVSRGSCGPACSSPAICCCGTGRCC